MIYDRVLNGEVVETRDHDEAPPELAPSKGVWLPHVVVGDGEFDPVTEIKTGPVVGIGEAEVTYTYEVRTKNPEEVDGMRAAKLAAVKAEAGRRILAIMPEHRQRNSLALGMEMVTTQGPDPAAWPEEVAARYQADMEAWAQIKAVRQRSDELEAAIPEEAAGVAAFDPLAGWA